MLFSIDDFCEKNNYTDLKDKYFSNFEITNTTKLANGIVVVNANNEKILPFKMYKDLIKYINSFDLGKVKLVISASNEYLSVFEIDEYVKYFAKKIGYFSKAVVVLRDNEILLEYDNQEELDKDSQSLDSLKLFLYDIGFKKKINLVIHDPNLDEKKEKVFKRKVSYEEREHTYTDSNKKRFAFTPRQYVPISEIQDPISDIRTAGKVLSQESRITKNGRVQYNVLLGDDHYNGIRCQIFENRNMSKDQLKMLNEVGNYVMVYGNYEYNQFYGDNVFTVNKEEAYSVDETLNDDAPKKRVELHTHTKYSAMDGVSSPEDIIQAAYEYGHKAVAITDHLDVQSFRHVHDKINKLKKADENCDLKIIYGCEFNVVNRYLECLYNPRNIDFKDATYVVFDLETTGLSSRYDSIIEFGACKMYKGNIIDRADFFINPQKKLPARITKLTGIKDSDVEGAKTFKECKDDILNFIGDSILVAHNALFDYGFLNEELKRIGEAPLTNTVIDTLNLSRMLFKEKKRFRLGNIANEFGVEYNDDEAHRADYDASVLSSIFNLIIKKLADMNINSVQELYDFKDDESFAKNRAYHVVALAKNRKGLKDLYKLVSISNTETLAVFSKSASKDGEGENVNAEPRLLKETLQKYRKNLLLGSACYNGEVFEMASTRGEKELADAISFFDYIEVQPFENYAPLKRTYDEDQIKSFIKNIIEEAKKQNKIVVATGDVHHVTSNEKIIRDVYVNSKGIGGARHPLYIYDKASRIVQDIPDQRFLNTNEMVKSFDWLDNEWLAKELVIENSNKIADMCEEVIPFTKDLYAPKIINAIEKARSCGIDEPPFTGLNEVISADEYLKRIVFYNAHKIYGDKLDEAIEKRINDELELIIGKGYGVIYYVCHLLIKRCNNDGFMVGSRGSVGSSLVARFAGITEVNALEPHYLCPHCHHLEWNNTVDSGYDLPNKKCPECGEDMIGEGQNIPFATFLGISGEKIPDIDLNFPSDYQGKAHDFTREIFGENNVFRAGTVSEVQEKTAFGYLNNYFEEKLISPFPRGKKEAYAIGCSGTKRTTGKHPGGIVVVPDELEIEDITPIQYSANDNTETWRTTHLDYHNFEDNLLKFDILGHVDPIAMLLLEKISGIKIKDIPMNDPKVISIFNSTDELKIVDELYDEETGGCGLPEFGTMVARSKLEDTRPTCFSDLVKINGLAHGTDVWEHNIADLIKNMGKKLKEVICCRDDVMLDLIKYNLDPKEAFHIMEAVRKGKSLKKDEEDKLLSLNVPRWYIDSCKKIKYLFPKAHAVAYTMMAYRVAWFKVYYPEYYYVSYFSLRCDAYEIETMVKDSHKILERMKQLQVLKAEKKASKKEKDIINTLEVCYEMNCRGYHMTNIDLSKSLAKEFLVNPDNHKEIIPPFIVIDGLGEAVANKIVSERDEKNKPFSSIQDLIDRTSIPKPIINKLEHMGVFKGMDQSNQTTLF